MKRSLFAAAVIAACAVSPVAAAEPVHVTADLDGTPIAVDRIADNYCTDRAFPVIHCFSSAAALESSRAAATSLAIQAAQPSDYVVVYSGTSYSGSYMYLSQGYDALAVVGWNDRIRSFHALNGLSGRFYTDWFASGAMMSFCCNSAVPSLSSIFDHQISSVYGG